MLNQLHLAMLELYKGDAKRIQHFCKVHSYAKLIAECEKVDKETLFVLEAAALTHDIGIHLCEEKYGDCSGKLQEKEGSAIAVRLLDELGFEKQVSERVQYLIAHHHTYHNIDGLDAVIQDALLLNIRILNTSCSISPFIVLLNSYLPFVKKKEPFTSSFLFIRRVEL